METVIEFFWILYMLATVAGVLSTFKLWQTKNLTPCLWSLSVTDPSVTLAHKVGPGLQDLQEQGWRILAERNAKKAEENMWIGRMVAAENINDMKVLIKSRDSAWVNQLSCPAPSLELELNL